MDSVKVTQSQIHECPMTSRAGENKVDRNADKARGTLWNGMELTPFVFFVLVNYRVRSTIKVIDKKILSSGSSVVQN